MQLERFDPAAEPLLLGQRALLERYADLLAGPGVERGLLGPREPARLWTRHLLNSATVASLIPEGSQVVDVGSGAGLPGVVLGCIRPDLTVVLVEPMERRTRFLEECVAQLRLDNTSVLRARAEDLHGRLRSATVTARAVAPLQRLVPMAAPLLDAGGQLLAVKGRTAAAELADVRPLLGQFQLDGGSLVHCGEGLLDPPTTVVRLRRAP